MDSRRITFAAIICAIAGTGLGLVLFTLVKPPFQSRTYRTLGSIYLVAGGVGGLLFGASQEALRQLKQARDAEEVAAQRLRSQRYHQLESDTGKGDRGSS